MLDHRNEVCSLFSSESNSSSSLFSFAGELVVALEKMAAEAANNESVPRWARASQLDVLARFGLGVSSRYARSHRAKRTKRTKRTKQTKQTKQTKHLFLYHLMRYDSPESVTFFCFHLFGLGRISVLKYSAKDLSVGYASRASPQYALFASLPPLLFKVCGPPQVHHRT